MEFEKTKENIIGLEIETASKNISGDIEILQIKVTTDNHGYSFVVGWEDGQKLKLGDSIEIKKELL